MGVLTADGHLLLLLLLCGKDLIWGGLDVWVRGRGEWEWPVSHVWLGGKDGTCHGGDGEGGGRVGCLWGDVSHRKGITKPIEVTSASSKVDI